MDNILETITVKQETCESCGDDVKALYINGDFISCVCSICGFEKGVILKAKYYDKVQRLKDVLLPDNILNRTEI